MKIIKQHVTILKDNIDESDEDLKKRIYLKLEKIARNAYASEHKNPNNNLSITIDFLKKIMRKKHLGILEHVQVSFEIVANRAILNELVRHRMASYVQNSTRYIRYNDDIEFIEPYGFVENSVEYNIWLKACRQSEHAYHKLLNNGINPGNARDVLNLSLASKIIVTMNLRSWLHYLELRLAKTAHPQIRTISNEISEILHGMLPIIF